MRVRGWILASAVAAMGLAFTGTAQGAVTIGSTMNGPADEINPGCGVGCTIMNPALSNPADVAPGGLSSPVNGTVTSWSYKMVIGGGSIALRILRPAGLPSFTGVGTSAPVTPISSGSPQGPVATSLPIKAGDFIALNASGGQSPLIDTAGTTTLYWNPQLMDGQTLPGTAGVRIVAIQATVEPSNKVTFGAVKRNTKRGSAKVTLNVPNGGALAYGGPVSVAGPTSMVVGASIQVTVKAKGKSKKKLDDKGKVKVKLAVTFTPKFGTAASSSTKVKLQKKLKPQRGNR
jgi:hypothetical protein